MERGSLLTRLLSNFATPTQTPHDVELGTEPHTLNNQVLRVLVYRSCGRRGRKILFDSWNVTDEGVYLEPPPDGKFLKDTVAEFVFGALSLNFNHDVFKFTLLQNKHNTKVTQPHTPNDNGSGGNDSGGTKFYTWSLLYLHSQEKKSLIRSSKSSSSSSSGYSSLPSTSTPPSCFNSDHPPYYLTSSNNHTPSDSNSNSNTSSNSSPCQNTPTGTSTSTNTFQKCKSLPSSFAASTDPRQSQLPRVSKTEIGIVYMVTKDLTTLSPSLESNLKRFKKLIERAYLTRTFAETLKSYSNSLETDILNYSALKRVEIVNANHFKSLVNYRFLGEYLYLLKNYREAKVVVVSKKRTELVDAIFYLNQLVKNWRLVKPELNAFSESESETSLGYHSWTSFNSSLSFGNYYGSGDMSGSGSGDMGMNGSGSGSESEEEPVRKGFYLDDIDDEQTETKLGLGNLVFKEVELNVARNVELELDDVKVMKSELYYHSSAVVKKWVSLVDNLLLTQVSYDYVHSISEEVIEVNLEKGIVRGVGLVDTLTHKPTDLTTFIDKLKQLVRLIPDIHKIEGFILTNLFS